MLAPGHEPPRALVSAASLAGDTLGELWFEVGLPIAELKLRLRSLINGGPHCQVMLLYDGGEPKDSQTLTELDIEPGGAVRFTVLIYDPWKLARMEMDQLYQEAIMRSRQEAAQQRKERLLRSSQAPMAPRWVPRAAPAETAEPAKPGAALMLGDQAAPLMLANAPAKEPPRVTRVPGKDSEGEARHPESTSTESAPVLSLANEPAFASVRKPAPRPVQDWRKEAAQVRLAYESFFDHITFRKGWREPPFARAEVAGPFETAARIVGRARREVLDLTEGLKLRQVDGSARDWMHSAESAEALRSPGSFTARLVHATFMDASGYVEGLSESQVDEFIQRFT